MAIEELKKDRMMAHLIATLDSGHSIGHYGRLVFAMVAHHFLEAEELVGYLSKDPECDDGCAKSLVSQVESRRYNPPKRERILEWMRKQDFPVCPTGTLIFRRMSMTASSSSMRSVRTRREVGDG